MSSSDNGQQSASGLQHPGLVSPLPPVEQQPFPESNPTFPRRISLPGFNRVSGPATPATDVYSSNASGNSTHQLPGVNGYPAVTRPLTFNASPAVTRQLPDVQTGTMPTVSPTTAFRQPVVIPATGKKSRGTMRPPQKMGRAWVTSSLALSALVVITLLTAFVVLPLATGGHLGFNLAAGDSKLYQNPDPNSYADLRAQAETQTAIQQTDGLDQTGNNGGSLYTGSGVTPDRFSFGQCTYFADYEYHRLTGYYVDWIGNAYQWASGAVAAGWNVSSSPHVPSIIVLQPGVEGAGWYGHVAVVERINPDGSVYSANMNWYANGGWDIKSFWTFTPGRGVLFVWHS